MKKIIITIIAVFVIIYANAQTGSLASENSQKVNNEDPGNPLVNGIPYSQYKAQVQAQQAAKSAAEARQIAEAKQQQQNMLGSVSRVGNAKQNTPAVNATQPPTSIKNTSVDNETNTELIKTIKNKTNNKP